jgi:hypothetical protein
MTLLVVCRSARSKASPATFYQSPLVIPGYPGSSQAVLGSLKFPNGELGLDLDGGDGGDGRGAAGGACAHFGQVDAVLGVSEYLRSGSKLSLRCSLRTDLKVFVSSSGFKPASLDLTGVGDVSCD